jgi:hypothetical protein
LGCHGGASQEKPYPDNSGAAFSFGKRYQHIGRTHFQVRQRKLSLIDFIDV